MKQPGKLTRMKRMFAQPLPIAKGPEEVVAVNLFGVSCAERGDDNDCTVSSVRLASMSQAAALAQHEENKQTMNAIDGGLDALVGQTRQISHNAKAIGTELSEQIEIMKDTNARMDVTDQKINAATDMVDKTTEKVGGSQLCQWICMVVLVLAIILLVALPIKFPDLRP
jgi:hypothetical protein